MLRNPESLGQSDQYGYDPESSDARLFIPSKEQAGLFGDELLPLSHRIPEALPETLSLQLEGVEDDKEGNVQQGEFERHDLSELNTVVQQRKIYEDIDILANNIKEEGLLIHPLLVARYTSEEQAHAYLVAAYGTVGKKIPPHERRRLVDLRQSTHNRTPCWYIVIAGHRRLRALEMLEEESSVVQIFDNMHPLRALKVQVSENTSRLPKDFERAEQNGDLWSVDKALEPKLTVEQFAKRVGHRADVIRRDLLYYGLPDELKNLVIPRGQEDTGHGNTRVASQSLMPFRVASQLGRMVEKGAPKHDVLFLARRFWDEGLASEEAASKRVSEYLKAFDQGNLSMDSLFNINAKETAKLKEKREAAKRFVGPLDSAINYFLQVAKAKEYGLPTDQDGISYRAAAKRMRILSMVVKGLIPDMKAHLTQERRGEIERYLSEWDELAKEYGGIGPGVGIGVDAMEMYLTKEFNLEDDNQ